MSKLKKLTLGLLALLLTVSLVGCSSQAKSEAEGAASPTLTLYGRDYVASSQMVEELPDDYVYIGDLSEDAAKDTGLAGCKMYAIKEKDSLPDFYLYQECEPSAEESASDQTDLPWAYVQWTLAE